MKTVYCEYRRSQWYSVQLISTEMSNEKYANYAKCEFTQIGEDLLQKGNN